jgi:CO/xanthine dehydrogenase Mo-binding subunit
MSTATPAKPKLPGSLNANRKLSQWLRFHRQGYVEALPGKVEIGQGIVTALQQIVADELDVPIDRVKMIRASTATSPNEAVTSGSLSIQDSGTALRHACAEARAIYLAAVAEEYHVPVESLSVERGEILGERVRTSYWAFADDTLLEREATGTVAPKLPSAHKLIGTSVPRADLPDKVFGTPRFIHDLVLPGMLHGRILRPASRGAKLLALDESAARAITGVVSVLRDGEFVGVIAETERGASLALEKLAAGARWDMPETLPDEATLPAWIKEQPVETTVVSRTESPPLADGTRTFRASYTKPYLAHASMGPSCALARWTDARDRVHVWTHSQGIYNLRHDLALAFRVPQDAIVCEHVEGAGCYGHNPADDVAYDAARLAREAPGRPVRVQWTRADELGWASYSPAMVVECEVDVAPEGRIVGWRHQVWSNGHGTRPGRDTKPALLGSWHLAEPFPVQIAVNSPVASGGGSERNAVPLYDFPHHVLNHRLLTMPIRTSALRSLGATGNVFAIESTMDEIAKTIGVDPVEFRLRHLVDPRSRAVVERAAARAKWSEWQKREGVGHGIAWAKYKNTSAYCAVVAEVEVAEVVRVKRLVIAVDVGLVINPDGVVNQVEGGAIQATSWALKEAVHFDRRRVTTDSWEAYPILTFSEVPAVEVEIVPRTDEPSKGAGEASQGPAVAAIANAIHDALGVRVRGLPFTPDQIVAASG